MITSRCSKDNKNGMMIRHPDRVLSPERVPACKLSTSTHAAPEEGMLSLRQGALFATRVKNSTAR